LTTSDKNPLAPARLCELIDRALERYARFTDGCPPQLAEAIRYALLGPGKRLRPQLVLLAVEACGGQIEPALPAACAVEMVHAYSLVHDDLPAMDDDDLRRGRPTCHVQFGEATAILVGDALLARAFEVLASEISPATTAAKCCAVLARAAGANALVGGQAADLDRAQRGRAPEGRALEELEAIHERKTGALFIAALELGGIIAGASQKQLAVLVAFGRNIGLAFQITDDLLDVAGNQSAVGKRLAKDAQQGKLTFPSVLGIEESRRRAEQLVNDACGMIEMFGAAGEPLATLARCIQWRDK